MMNATTINAALSFVNIFITVKLFPLILSPVRVYWLVQSPVIIMQIFMLIHILISGVPVVQMSTASLHI